MATSSEHLCVVCGEGVGSSGGKLGIKGLTTFIAVSKKRADGLHQDVSSTAENFVHDHCYKSYTAPKKSSQLKRLIALLKEVSHPFHHCGMDKTLSSMRPIVSSVQRN